MKRKGPFGFTILIVMAVVILCVISVPAFSDVPCGGLQFSDAVAAVAAQEAAHGGPVPETPLREESGTDDKSIYRTPLRILSVAAVALLLVWYIRKRMKL